MENFNSWNAPHCLNQFQIELILLCTKYEGGGFLSKRCGLGPVGFPKQAPIRCQMDGFPLSLS